MNDPLFSLPRVLSRMGLLALCLCSSTLLLAQRDGSIKLELLEAQGKSLLVVDSLKTCGVPEETFFYSNIELDDIGTSINVEDTLYIDFSDYSGIRFSWKLAPPMTWQNQSRTLTWPCFDSTYYRPNLLLVSEIVDYGTGETLDSTWVIIQGTQQRDSVLWVAGVDIELAVQDEFIIEYSRPGYYSKSLAFDTRLDPWYIGSGFVLDVKMNMIEERVGVVLPVLKKPMGECRYARESDNFVWNMDDISAFKSVLEEQMKAWHDLDESEE